MFSIILHIHGVVAEYKALDIVYVYNPFYIYIYPSLDLCLV